MIMLAISGCCHKKKLARQLADNTVTSQQTFANYDYMKFESYYYHTTESTYEEVAIKEGKLSYTYFKDEKGDCSQWMQQKPCWTKEALKTKEVSLTEADIDSLTNKIEKYNFKKLDTIIGNPAETDRYYTFILSFKTSSLNNKVLFKSVPGGVTMPDAFRKSRDELMKLVRKKIGFN
jgi:hypothetical protein